MGNIAGATTTIVATIVATVIGTGAIYLVVELELLALLLPSGLGALVLVVAEAAQPVVVLLSPHRSPYTISLMEVEGIQTWIVPK